MTWTEGQFDGFFRGVYPRVLRSSHLLLGDRAAAEDVAQEAFARLLAREPLAFPDAERWVFKVARNLGISRGALAADASTGGGSDADLRRAELRGDRPGHRPHVRCDQAGVGGMVVGNGVRVGDTDPDGFRTHYPDAPELSIGSPAAAVPTNRGTMTWRIRTWSDWQGIRFGETEQWVTGPVGIGFALRLGIYGDLSLLGSFGAEFVRDEERVFFTSFLRSRVGLSPRKLHRRGRLPE